MLKIKGPRDSNGNRREFYLTADMFSTAEADDEEINVTPKEFRRLSRLFGEELNAADADEELFDE